MFSVESILFSDDSNRSSEAIIPVSLKTGDACIKDVVNSLEELEFIDTYAKINDHNQRLKMQMCKRLANITNNIRNSQARNSCESYLYNAAFSTEDEKEGGWLKRVWQAIVTTAVRVVDAIVNFVRWLGTVIAGLDTKKQIEHFKIYMDNKSKITTEVDNKVGKKKIKSPAWKVNKDDILNKIKDLTKEFSIFSNLNANDPKAKLIEKISRTTLKDDDELEKLVDQSFGGPDKLMAMLEDAQEMKNIKQLLDPNNAERSKKSPKEIVSSFALKTDKTIEIPISEIKKISGDFTCLSEGNVVKASKDMMEQLKKFQKSYTTFTKNIKAVAIQMTKHGEVKDAYKSKLDDAETKEDKNKIKKSYKTGMNKLKNMIAKMTNNRIKTNSMLTAVGLEFQMMVFRFNKVAHIALKAYLTEIKVLKGKEDKQTAKDAKKGVGLAGEASTTESYD